jgi:predicted ATPase with chaperone activity
MWIDRIDHAVLMLRDIPAPALSTIGSLRHSPGIIALVPLARERGLDTVYMPAIDAREETLLTALVALRRREVDTGAISAWHPGVLFLDELPKFG